MALWFNTTATPESLNQWRSGTMVEHIGIEYTVVGEDFLEATMPVDYRTKQPAGLLHGGASVALAETLGSVAAFLCIDPAKKMCVGLEINANHIRSVENGTVTGVARPLHVGNTTHVWEIRISNDEGKLCCISRITMAILDKR